MRWCVICTQCTRMCCTIQIADLASSKIACSGIATEQWPRSRIGVAISSHVSMRSLLGRHWTRGCNQSRDARLRLMRPVQASWRAQSSVDEARGGRAAHALPASTVGFFSEELDKRAVDRVVEISTADGYVLVRRRCNSCCHSRASPCLSSSSRDASRASSASTDDSRTVPCTVPGRDMCVRASSGASCRGTTPRVRRECTCASSASPDTSHLTIPGG